MTAFSFGYYPITSQYQSGIVEFIPPSPYLLSRYKQVAHRYSVFGLSFLVISRGNNSFEGMISQNAIHILVHALCEADIQCLYVSKV